MADVEYTEVLDNASWEEISALFQLVGWGIREPDEVRKAFGTSSNVILVKIDGNIVGFGRTVDDGKYYALIVDLVVKPEFQNMGIGSRILTMLKDRLEGYVFTTLTSVPGKESYYLKRGWARQKTAFIWPRSAEQRADHVDGVSRQ